MQNISVVILSHAYVHIFNEWLNRNNNRFSIPRQHIVLIVNIASCHKVTLPHTKQVMHSFKTCKLSNIRVIYLPPNCTMITLSMDQGIIQMVKMQFRKSFCKHVLRQMDKAPSSSASAHKINLRDAIILIHYLWDEAKHEKIANCWRHYHICPTSLVHETMREPMMIKRWHLCRWSDEFRC